MNLQDDSYVCIQVKMSKYYKIWVNNSTKLTFREKINKFVNTYLGLGHRNIFFWAQRPL